MNIRRQARNHVSGLERLGYQVTIQAINPDTGELASPQPPDPLTQSRAALSAAGRCRAPSKRSGFRTSRLWPGVTR